MQQNPYFYICGYGQKALLAKSLADPSTAILESIGFFLGSASKDAVCILLCTSVVACLLTLHNILSRYVYCLGVDGTLPRAWAPVHPRFGSPARASLIVSTLVLATLVVLINSSVRPYAGYSVLTAVGGYALLLLLILTSLAVVGFFAGPENQSIIGKPATPQPSVSCC